MTRDEILAMEPGRELDAQVARAIGYVSMTTQLNHDGTYGTLPFFSTNMTAAWEAAQKEGIAVIPQSSDNGYRWFACDVESVVYRGSEIAINERDDSGVSCDTAPEAICKAALLAARGGEQPEARS